MLTHEFKLLSGPRCVVREFTGEDSEIFTKKKNIETGIAFDLLLKNIILEIEGLENAKNKVGELLSADRAKILFEARQFSYDFPETYVTAETFGKLKQEFEFSLADVEQKLYAFQAESYADVLQKAKIETILPKTNQKVLFYCLNGNAELKMMKVNQDEVSLNTMINLRKPCYMSDGREISLDLNKLPISDISFLLSEIEKAEGKMDLLFQISNPNNPSELKSINLLARRDFFFPNRI